MHTSNPQGCWQEPAQSAIISQTEKDFALYHCVKLQRKTILAPGRILRMQCQLKVTNGKACLSLPLQLHVHCTSLHNRIQTQGKIVFKPRLN